MAEIIVVAITIILYNFSGIFLTIAIPKITPNKIDGKINKSK